MRAFILIPSPIIAVIIPGKALVAHSSHTEYDRRLRRREMGKRKRKLQPLEQKAWSVSTSGEQGINGLALASGMPG